MLQNIIHSPDGKIYHGIALNLLNKKGFVIDSIHARRPPVYPAFLAIVYFFSRHSIVLVRFVQSIIGALSCVVLYLIGAQMFNEKVGLIAGIISAIDYSILQISAYIVSETVYIFLLLCTLFYICKYYKTNTLLYLSLSGIFIGLTTLCKESALFLIPLVAIWLFWLKDNILISRFKVITFFLFCCLIPIMPWSTRNFRIYHKWIPFTASSGHSLYIGNNQETIALNGGHDTPSIITENIPTLFTPEADNLLRKKAIDFMISNPKRCLDLAWGKLINMWQPYYSDASMISRVVMVFSYLPIVFLGLTGFAVSVRSSKISLLFLAIIGFYALLHMFTVSGIRYRYPLMPLFMVHAAFILDKFFCNLSKRFFKYEK
jgi:4-amino-4-deoxy-L-arabinose transferase-like glycosyltransferase